MPMVALQLRFGIQYIFEATCVTLTGFAAVVLTAYVLSRRGVERLGSETQALRALLRARGSFFFFFVFSFFLFCFVCACLCLSVSLSEFLFVWL